MLIHMLEYFIEKADDPHAKEIMTDLYNNINPYANKIIQIFQAEGLPIPIGFTKEDVRKEVPNL
jgi:hypothetical protein